MTAAVSVSDILGDGGLLLVGCGKMGGAMLQGWLNAAAPAEKILVVEPHPSAELTGVRGLRVAPTLEALEIKTPPNVLLMAVKPQMMADVLPQAARVMSDKTLLLSIAAGAPISLFEAAAPAGAPIIRSMPNTPAAVGAGVTAIIGNRAATAAHLDAAEALLTVVGDVVRLTDEAQIDAVTGLSGSGPAYVFHMIEALAAAGEAEGLPPELAMRLARGTVCGAGALAAQSPRSAEQLRVDVTSRGGTTAAGLQVLMRRPDGLQRLIAETVAAAAARSRELRG
ncbi:MAG: pyrroline-5-carboxylate reductase [Neomegalonema sp.]|nr:pyrroline-5-carboxylate reductase [Neomegalonema sp.]